MPKIMDRFSLTYLDDATNKVGINPELQLLELIKTTHPNHYEKIADKNSFLSDINEVNALLQEIYLKDNELRWQVSEHVSEIDAFLDKMPHQEGTTSMVNGNIDLMIFPGTTGVSMMAIAATARDAILNGLKVKHIAVLGGMQEWKTEWVEEVKTIFTLRPDLLKPGVDLAQVDFNKIYTEHGVNALITTLMDFGDSNIDFQFLPVPMQKLTDRKLRTPTSDDAARVLFEYYSQLKLQLNKSPETLLVANKGFHIRQSYSFLAVGISSLNILVSEPTILGDKVGETFKRLVYPSTRSKLDNLARTIYQTKQVLPIIYPQLAQKIEEKQPMPSIASNKNSFVNQLSNVSTSKTSAIEADTTVFSFK